jgi:hypothetical protein
MGVMDEDVVSAEHPATVARLVERIALTDPQAAVEALGQLELEVDRYMTTVDGGLEQERRMRDFRRLMSSLRSSVSRGRVRSLTGLERQVRMLTREA